MAYHYESIAALADPTRRTVFELVAAKPRSVADLARELPVSQPAVSQHLKVLREARLVRAEPAGRRQIYHIDPAGLGQMRAWLDQFWDRALDGFQTEINKTKEEDKK